MDVKRMTTKTWQLAEGCVETLWETGFLLQFTAHNADGFGQVSGLGEAPTAPLQGVELGVLAGDGETFQICYPLDAARGGVLRGTRHPGPSGPGHVEIHENERSLIHVLEPGGEPARIPRDAKTLLFLGRGDLTRLAGMDELVELALVGGTDLTGLPAFPALASVLVAENTKVETLEGLQRSPKVQTVKVANCPQLRDVRSLNGVPELSELSLDQYTQLNIIDLAMQMAAGVLVTIVNPLLFPPEENE